MTRDSDGAGPQPASGDRRDVLKSALAAIERLQSRIDAADYARHEPIAIVGMSCRLPGGAENPDAYWSLLAEGRDAVSEVPADRWDVEAYHSKDPGVPGKAYTKAGGFLSKLDEFDPGFFGMSPREAVGLDPQQRLLLETAWEALEDAAIPADQLDGSLTGVFVGITSTDYADRIDVSDPARSDIYIATGTALNAAAGRLSFTFGLRGPCMAIDTACSSSLVAIHAACQSLRNRESNLVLAGGVNCLLSPDPFVLISKWGMLSPDGRCKTFDASANGFVRAEGCGLIVLERLSDALAKGRNVLAVIRGSAINQDGRSSGLTVPNGLAQQEVLRAALAASRLRPTDVSYVEAHGTGTSLGDPIEVEALAAVYGEGRSSDQPLEVGSVKSNIGHLEAASGVASLIKLVLSLRNRQIPASLHVKQLSPAIPWQEIPVTVSTGLHDWKSGKGPRTAGVSAFGFSGMNAHLIVQEAPEAGRPIDPAAQPSRAAHVLPLSARSDQALRQVAARYADVLQQAPHTALDEICATAAVGRSHLEMRGAAVAAERTAMLQKLRELAAGDKSAVRGTAQPGARLRVAFLFTGQGSQYVGMGRELDESEPVFRATIDRCAAVLDPLLGMPLRRILFELDDGSLNNTGYAQPALYAVEVALAALWKSWGIEPAIVIGHSVGEFAAAAVAGVLSIEEGARLISARARLMQQLPAGGAMLSVQGAASSIQSTVAAMGGQLSLAAFNAPDSLVLSGKVEAIAAIAPQLTQLGATVQALQVSHAFHSQLMEPMLEPFRAVAAEFRHDAPRMIWISSMTGQSLDWEHWGARMPEYWVRQVREPVLFQKAIAAALACNPDVFLEIGPHPSLSGLAKQCMEPNAELECLPSMRRSRPQPHQMLDSLSRLYVRGAKVDWSAIYARPARLGARLPTYPFQRKRYLVPPQARAARPLGPVVHPLLGTRLPVAGVVAQFEFELDSVTPGWISDHRIASQVVMPMTGLLEASLAAARHATGSREAILEDVVIYSPLVLRDAERSTQQVIVDQPTPTAPMRVRIFSRSASEPDGSWILHTSANVGNSPSSTSRWPSRTAPDSLAGMTSADVPAFFARTAEVGVEFGPKFRGLRRATFGDRVAEGEISSEGMEESGDSSYLFPPNLLDACFHVCAFATESSSGPSKEQMFLPIGAERYSWYQRPAGPLRSRVNCREISVQGDTIVFDIWIETLDGVPVAEVEGLRCRTASRESIQVPVGRRVADWFYSLAWQQEPLPQRPHGPAPAHWLVLDERNGRGARLAEEIRLRGANAILLPMLESASPGLVPDSIVRALKAGGVKGDGYGLACLWPTLVPDANLRRAPGQLQDYGTHAILSLLHGLDGLQVPAPTRVCIVTSGAQAVDGTEVVNVAQSPVVGMARVAGTEKPALGICQFDLDPQGRVSDVAKLAEELLSASPEREVALRKGVRWVPRLVRHAPGGERTAADEPVRLAIRDRGTLENLKIERFEPAEPGPGEVQIRVRASGLNFRDVLGALGLYPGELSRLGSDCAGEITAVGSEVKGLAIGDRVVAMVSGAFASYATTRWEFVAPLPAGVDFEQGAAIPSAYLTAAITLELVAGMKPEHSVLIHSGAGGVGMAAIALARRTGSTIFATAGSDEKRDALRRLGVHHVFDSRSVSFADELLRITGGKGVDIVLNSLAGELLDRSFDCVSDGGTFIEIGKRGVWSPERVEALDRRIKYHIIDCNDYARDTPQLVGQIFARVLRDIDAGSLTWLPCVTFPFDRAVDAFRYMAQARHIGRVVLRHPVVTPFAVRDMKPDATYLVTGGLKGLGFATAKWLAGQGARHLLLVGRGAPDQAGALEIDRMRSTGIRIEVLAADVSSQEGTDKIFDALAGDMPPLGGVVHCAAVLDDGVLSNQTSDRLDAVMGPKGDAAWRLHVGLEERKLRPEFFVLYSSLSTIFGSAGQGNYVAANACLDALANHRRARGLPATSVGWGAWGQIGMATRADTLSRASSRGVRTISPEDGLEALRQVLADGATYVAVAPIDWATLARQFTQDSVPPVLQRLMTAATSPTGGSGGPSRRAAVESLEGLDPVVRLERLAALVRSELGTVLALGSAVETVPSDQTFASLGLDSLTSMELRNRLQMVLGRPVSATAAFSRPTIAELAQHLNESYGTSATDGAIPATNREEQREEIDL